MITNNNLLNTISEKENEKYISEFMKKFLNDRIKTIDGQTKIRDKDKL